MAKPASESNYDSDNVTHEFDKKTTIEIGDEFVKILQDNAFNGVDGGDVIEHIAKVLEILEWIKMPDVDKDRLRLHIFPISLNRRAKEWWDNEIKDTITTWKDLSKKFFHKYYPLSLTYHSKIPDDLDKGTYYLEFLEWLGSKFKNHWNMEENTKNGLYAQEGNGIYNFKESNQYSPPIPVPIEYDINNPVEVSKFKEFKVIRYSIGTDEEFITISPSKYDTWGKTYGSMPYIYHDVFNKKFRGWLDAIRRPCCTDMSKIIRKPSKTGKHGHEERKSTKEAKDSKPKPRKVNPWSILGQQKSTHKRTKPQKLPL
ncbi:hypothetical protein Tco_0389012 [Tanacetum coccineum]